MSAELHLGVDVGGTNTDAVILDQSGTLLARAKVSTCPDIRSGIERAVDIVLAAPGVEARRVRRVMVGTTHAANAILQRQALQKVAVIRLGAPLTMAVPPLSTWPADLRAAISVGEVVVAGGYDYDGEELAPLDREKIARFVSTRAGACDAVAITGVFSPVSAGHELEAAEIVHRELGDVEICLSHQIGTVGLVERENATVLNASLIGFAGSVARGLVDALASRGLSADTFFAQNDGTLMALEFALSFPVLTIASGPANSMRGAAFLSGAEDAIVVDVGGSTADIGALVRGFPHESSTVRLGGVETNFRMPDILSVAVGGGSRIDEAGCLAVPSESIGSRLTSEALVFGGSTPTLTDAAVEHGRMSLGTRKPPRKWRTRLAVALGGADSLIADGIDRTRLTSEPWPLVAVGGASALVPDQIPGVSEVIRPVNEDVANAIGAAIAPVSGSAERICPNRPDRKSAAVDDACEEAFARTVQAGADPRRVQIAEIDEVPLSYLVDPAIRIRVRAVGALLQVSAAVPSADGS
jgi:N-methylhydantoinase A/oxoprolinase/acetone carboxylase beta subunit